MLQSFIKKNRFLFLTIAIIVSFFIIKFSYLYLPFYWDEAWVYGPAVRLMAINGISLLPDALPVDLYRGHPMLFHSLNAVWLKIAGNTIFSAHFFNLVISGILILVVFLFCRKFFNEQIGVAAAFVLCLQSVFLAQSTLVLPEMMLALFCLTALYFYLQHKYVLYIIFSAAALLTKETGIAVIIACGIHYAFFKWDKKITIFSYLKGMVKMAIPVIPFIVFLMLQKKMQGWYFFPEHIGYISLDFKEVWSKFVTRYITFTFLLQGRNLLFFGLIISLGLLIYKKEKIPHVEILVALLIFILIYSLIGSFNFFSKRYILSNIPVFIVMSMGLAFTVFQNKFILWGFLVVYAVAQIQYIQDKNNSDHTLGFADAVKANQSMIDYCMEKNMKNDSIAVFFIQGRIMTDSLAGYIRSDEVFTNLSDRLYESKFAIISNYDTRDDFLNFRKENGVVILKRFEYGKAWIELYKNQRVLEP